MLANKRAHDHNPRKHMTCCRNINFVTHGFGAPTNYNAAGPLGNQFATPFGDPYRVSSVGFSLGGLWSGITSFVGNIGKVAAPVLPGLVQVGVGTLIGPKQEAPSQQPPQSQFTQVTGQTQAQIDAAKTEKSNTAVYVAVGAVALIAAYYFLSKRRR